VTMHIDLNALGETLGRLRSTASGDGVGPALRNVCTTAVELFAVEGAGILVVDDDAVLRTIAASDREATALERAHERTGEGPCVDAINLDTIVQTSDVGSDDRWPALAAELEASSIRAVLGVPVHAGGAAIGSLNVYRRDPYDWDDSDVEAIAAFSGVAENLVSTALLAQSHESVIEQLRHALDSRVVIERAVGVLMSQQRIDAGAAFTQLREAAREERRKVADLAAEVLASVGPEPERSHPPTSMV
jgi:GAF domain-containing protein